MTAPYLKTGLPAGTSRAARDAGGERDEPDDQRRRRIAAALAAAPTDDEQRFREALSARDRAQSCADADPRSDGTRAGLPHAVAGSAAADVSVAAPSQAASLQHISAQISQVLVDDTPGRRVLRARLHDDVAPGVTLSLHESGQTLMIHLLCRHADAFDEMAGLRYALAQRLAARLHQRVHVMVGQESRPGATLEAVAEAAPAAPAP